MVNNKFSNYTDNELQALVEELNNDSLKCTISELKELQSELINRRANPQQIAAVSQLIMRQISIGSKAQEDTKTKSHPNKPAVDTIRHEDKSEKKPELQKSESRIDQLRPYPIDKKDIIQEDEKFPVLSFLVLFYKIIGWLGVVVILGGFSIFAIYFLHDNIPMILCGSGLSLIASALFLLIFTALSENVSWKLEIEKLLRKGLYR